MISGTYVLTDSIDQAFDRIFTDIRKGSNAVITGKSAFDLSDGSGVTEPTFDESLLDEVRALPGVAEAEGSVDSDATQLIGDDGKAVVFGGAPNLGFSIANGDSRFNPLTLVEGTWPGPDEVAIDKETAAKEDFEVGETIGVQAEGPVERMRVSGIVQFSSGPHDRRRDARRLRPPDRAASLQEGRPARRDRGRREAGRHADRARRSDRGRSCRRGRRCGPGRSRRRPMRRTRTSSSRFLQTFLLAFGGIALFVGSFVIANSLSITIAQRTREFATLRTIGATNRQVLGSVIVEALVVGVVASVVGLFLGLLLAKGLFELFDAVGFTLPNTGLVFEPRTIVVALAAGILVTVLASVYPGFRATTVPPIAAVREGAVLPGEPLDRIRGTVLGAAADRWSASSSASFAISTTPGQHARDGRCSPCSGSSSMLFGCALFPSRTRRRARLRRRSGFAALLYGLFVPGLGTTSVLLWMGVGVLLVFFGVARVTTRLIPWLAVADVADRTLVGLPAERARLAVLHAPVLAPPARRMGAGRRWPSESGAFVVGALINPLCFSCRARDVGPQGGQRLAARVAGGVPRRRSRRVDDATSGARTRGATRSAPRRPRAR